MATKKNPSTTSLIIIAGIFIVFLFSYGYATNSNWLSRPARPLGAQMSPEANRGVEIIEPEDGTYTTGKTSIPIVARTSEPSTLIVIDILGGFTAKTCNRATSCTHYVDVNKLAPGEHTYVAISIDPQGNVTSSKVSITKP